MNAAIISKNDWDNLPSKIVEKIIEISNKSYGVKFISRETGKKYDDAALYGLFTLGIQSAMNEINS